MAHDPTRSWPTGKGPDDTSIPGAAWLELLDGQAFPVVGAGAMVRDGNAWTPASSSNPLHVRAQALEQLIGALNATKETNPDAASASMLALLRGLIAIVGKEATLGQILAALGAPAQESTLVDVLAALTTLAGTIDSGAQKVTLTGPDGQPINSSNPLPTKDDALAALLGELNNAPVTDPSATSATVLQLLRGLLAVAGRETTLAAVKAAIDELTARTATEETLSATRDALDSLAQRGLATEVTLAQAAQALATLAGTVADGAQKVTLSGSITEHAVATNATLAAGTTAVHSVTITAPFRVVMRLPSNPDTPWRIAELPNIPTWPVGGRRDLLVSNGSEITLGNGFRASAWTDVIQPIAVSNRIRVDNESESQDLNYTLYIIEYPVGGGIAVDPA